MYAALEKNAGKPENGHPAAGLAYREQQGDHGAQQHGQDTHAKSRQQIVQDLGAELHAVRVYHHGWHNDVHQQIGKRLFVFQLEHTGLDRHHACADQQEQDRDLLRGDESQFHCIVLL